MRQGLNDEQPRCVLRFRGIKDLVANIRHRTGLGKFVSVKSLREFFAEYPSLLVHPERVDALDVADTVVVLAVIVPLLAAAAEGASSAQLIGLLADWPAWSYLHLRTARGYWWFLLVFTHHACIVIWWTSCFLMYVHARLAQISGALIFALLSACIAHRCRVASEQAVGYE